VHGQSDVIEMRKSASSCRDTPPLHSSGTRSFFSCVHSSVCAFVTISLSKRLTYLCCSMGK